MSTSNSNDDDTKVVLEQTLFKTDEAFVYRIPPMMTSGGHHASDWDLANPVATCSVHVLRRDSDLLIKLLADKPKLNAPPGATEKYLFAQSKITLDFTSSSASSSAVTADANTNAAKAKLKIEHWVETVTDSSRYFVIRISDEKRNKEAHVGMGFRERNDSMNFKMSLQDYENTMKKEAMVISSSNSNSNSRNDNDDKATSTGGGSGVGEEPSSGIQPSKSEDFSDMNNSSTSNTPIEAAVSKLSLKEGEKIHINLKASSSPSPSKNRTKRSSITGSGSKPPMLLRKPPPPASSTGTGAPVPLPPTSSSMPSSSSLSSKKVNVVINTDALKIQNDLHFNNSNGGGSHSHQADNSCVSSVAAVAETFEHDSDDEWGDFESPSFNED